jgi:2-dehydro-3-deoxygluconokinase
MAIAEVDWEWIADARHLHLTGITPALSEGCADLVAQAARLAHKLGKTVSFDINYRRKLWPPDRARSVISEIIREMDLLFSPATDAAEILGLSGSPTDIARALQQQFALRNVVVTSGKSGCVALEGEQLHTVDALESTEVDRVGGGDAFDAGVLDGFLDGDLGRGLRFGVAMAAIKYTIPGDQLIANRAEIEAVASGVSTHIVR